MDTHIGNTGLLVKILTYVLRVLKKHLHGNTRCHPERSEGSPRRLHIQHIINRHPEEGQAQGVAECDTLTMPRRGDLPLFNGGGERLVSVSAKHYNQW